MPSDIALLKSIVAPFVSFDGDLAIERISGEKMQSGGDLSELVVEALVQRGGWGSLPGVRAYAVNKQLTYACEFSFSLWPDTDSYIRGWVPARYQEQLLSMVAQVVSDLDLPYATVSRNRDFDSVHYEHAIAKRDVSDDRRFRRVQALDGLSGLAWRTVLGAPMVELITEERLRALGDESEQLADNVWMVCGGAGVEDRIGREFFYQRETETLPTVRPELATPYSVILVGDQGQLVVVDLNGSRHLVGDHPLTVRLPGGRL